MEAYEKLDTDIKLVMAGASSYCDDYSRRLQAHAGERIKMLDWVSGEVLDELLTQCHGVCLAVRSGGLVAGAAGCDGRGILRAEQ